MLFQLEPHSDGFAQPCAVSTYREMHIAAEARRRYQLDESFFSISGRLVFANFHAARVLADRINQARGAGADPDKAVHASELVAAGLLHEIYHYVISRYLNQHPGVMPDALRRAESNLGEDRLNSTLVEVVLRFPPLSVYLNRADPKKYLFAETGATPNREITLEEIILIRLANENEALQPFEDLIDDAPLGKAYRTLFQHMERFFDDQPPVGPAEETLVELLRAPMRKGGKTLVDQLQYIRKNWTSLLDDTFITRLLRSLDFVKEEEKARWLRFHGPHPGPPSLEEFDFSTLDHEPERFSEDLDWMPRVVMIAKSTLVWLDQLSKKYERHIHRLDQIPDEELNILANCGFTALWLIGLWERSNASKRIKQIMGNPEAESSAYALNEYEIAESLGGNPAYENLKERCWRRGIRLASDMVPNHTALDAKWVYDHPDWFLQLPYSPFPSYSFNGENLSNRPGVGIYLEDHYYDRTDAAVVFKRVDFQSGEARYIYHGNDGTSMPWNDTAQINYMLPHVREAVIQTILHVARMFPVIRFDAAMLLAKKHFQRLWFPEPGSGGGIPSRAEHGMTRREFDRHMPEEFWREVVERIQREVPDTLLLAEAFWFMEGYFVRSLGMHRVYNSAFMNMLKLEENAKYRKVIKDTLEFDPEILKRYVNFMNNPDEETAVAQFGKGDKYFGVCMMLVTMPGLPMFGHGQLEGFTEKYGMEYRRAMHDEHVDEVLFDRHRREIFPLMKRRHLFAEVRDFLLYDFYADGGGVNEDVFAYSNRLGDERALVIFNNKYASAAGRIHRSAAFLNKNAAGNDRTLVHHTLRNGLSLPAEADVFCIYRDLISGREYIHQSKSMSERGLYFKLRAYEFHVFVDFRFEKDHEDERYARLAYELGGKGVPSVADSLKDLLLRPLHDAFYRVCNPETISLLLEKAGPKASDKAMLWDDVAPPWEQFAEAALKELGTTPSKIPDGSRVGAQSEAAAREIVRIAEYARTSGAESKGPGAPAEDADFPASPPTGGPRPAPAVYLWRLLAPIQQLADVDASLVEELRLQKVIRNALEGAGFSREEADSAVTVLNILLLHQDALDAEDDAHDLLRDLLDDRHVRRLAGIHEYDGVMWFRKEGFESLAWYLLAAHYLERWLRSKSTVEPYEGIAGAAEIVRTWIKALADSEFRVGRLLSLLESPEGSRNREDDREESAESASVSRPRKG